MTDTSSQDGVTIVEFAIGLAILSAFALAMTQIVPTSATLASTATVLGRLDEAVGQTTMAVGSELRWARPDTLLITTDNGCDRADFVVATDYVGGATTWSTAIVIRYEPVDGDANDNGVADEGNLVRIQDGVTRVLCRNVDHGSFTIVDDAGRIQVGITVFGRASSGEVLRRTGQYSTNLVNR